MYYNLRSSLPLTDIRVIAHLSVVSNIAMSYVVQVSFLYICNYIFGFELQGQNLHAFVL